MGGTGIGFGVTTGVGCVVGETPMCPDAVLASNGTHGMAQGGGRTPNPPTNPDPHAFPAPDSNTPLGFHQMSLTPMYLMHHLLHITNRNVNISPYPCISIFNTLSTRASSCLWLQILSQISCSYLSSCLQPLIPPCL